MHLAIEATGLGLMLLGGVLTYWFKVPRLLETGGHEILVTGQATHEEKQKWHSRLGSMGLFFIVIGLLLQMASVSMEANIFSLQD